RRRRDPLLSGPARRPKNRLGFLLEGPLRGGVGEPPRGRLGPPADVSLGLPQDSLRSGTAGERRRARIRDPPPSSAAPLLRSHPGSGTETCSWAIRHLSP